MPHAPVVFAPQWQGSCAPSRANWVETYMRRAESERPHVIEELSAAPRIASRGSLRFVQSQAAGQKISRELCRGSLQNRAGDREALHLRRALVDLSNLGIAHHTLYRVLTRIPIAAQ